MNFILDNSAILALKIYHAFRALQETVDVTACDQSFEVVVGLTTVGVQSAMCFRHQNEVPRIVWAFMCKVTDSIVLRYANEEGHIKRDSYNKHPYVNYETAPRMSYYEQHIELAASEIYRFLSTGVLPTHTEPL